MIEDNDIEYYPYQANGNNVKKFLYADDINNNNT